MRSLVMRIQSTVKMKEVRYCQSLHGPPRPHPWGELPAADGLLINVPSEGARKSVDKDADSTRRVTNRARFSDQRLSSHRVDFGDYVVYPKNDRVSTNKSSSSVCQRAETG